MAHALWSQDIFSKGEITPLMYARVSVTPYYNGLKKASNVITYPQGAAGKRFGTILTAQIPTVTASNQIYFESMQYLNECVYLILIIPNQILIYLEGVLVQTVTGSPIGANLIPLIDHTVLDNIFRVTTGSIAPQDITRSADGSGTPNTITGFNTMTNVITMTTTTTYTSGLILPVRFSFESGGSNALFTSTPQILLNRTYFLYFLSATTAQIYYDAPSAKAQINPIVLLGSGTGTQYCTTFNTWAINSTVFDNQPCYDFSGGISYQNLTFTPSAISSTGNTPIYITASGNIFTPAMVGGYFEGNSGLIRLVANASNSATVQYGITINYLAFTSTDAISGINCILTQPVWSNATGWPRVCSSFQNRAFFANTDLLPNGLWGSVTNDYNNFDNSESLADNAISWYPTSDDINFIRFIVPYRSLTIHTNSGVFSTPLSVETAITPLNFSLTIQDSTPAEAVQPRGIDNQIIILSGNDAHSLLWDGFNNAYQSNIISIANEQLIRDPIYEAAFVDLTRAGSRYMLIVNATGSLAIYQTLISEEVQGFTPAYLEQPYGQAWFRNVTTSYDGRGWFITERQIATAGSPIAITNYTNTTLYASSIALSTTTPTAIQFATSGTLPSPVVNTPSITTGEWYWAIGTDTNDFMVYATQYDAFTNTNPYQFSNAGTSSTVTAWPLVNNFFIEELSFEIFTDFTTVYKGTPASTFTGLNFYNAQDLQINGDGYGFDYVGMNNAVETLAHGVAQDVSYAAIGLPINVNIQPLPLSIFGSSAKTTDLLSPKHIRSVSSMYADTIGGEINGVPLALNNFNQYPIGRPPYPMNGVVETSIMQGWDDFNNIGIEITHSAPFGFKLIGLFYKVDV